MSIVRSNMILNRCVQETHEAVMQTKDVDRIVWIEFMVILQMGESPRILLSELLSGLFPLALNWRIAGRFASDKGSPVVTCYYGQWTYLYKDKLFHSPRTSNIWAQIPLFSPP